jgi:hypothetical protein
MRTQRMIPWLLPTLVLAVLLGAVAIFLYRPNSTETAMASVAPHQPESAPDPLLQRARTGLPVAAQRAGPPDPFAQRSAAASAEKAAEAAAVLSAAADKAAERRQ